MESWIMAKNYLLGNGNLISYVDDFVHLTRKCRSFINQGAVGYELVELKLVNREIKTAFANYNLAVRYLGEDFYLPETANIADNALNVISAAIKEKTPRVANKSSKKEARQGKAKLNRSYGRNKNRR